MYKFLAQHPEIFVPETKEIHFFGTDIYSPNYLRDEQRYLSFFAAVANEKKIGEASVWYLFSKRAAQEIKEFCPSAGIIIMLRDPVDVIHSLYSHRFYLGTEDIEDFEEALNAEEARKQGLRLPKNPYPIEGLLYREVGQFTDQVKRYFDVFGREKVKVIIYDDFKFDAARICKETFEFLDVDASFVPEIRIINQNKKIRSKAVRSLIETPPWPVRSLVRPLTTPELRHRLYLTLRNLNTNNVVRPPLPENLRRAFQRYFALDVERLSKLLDRDLTHWSQASSNQH